MTKKLFILFLCFLSYKNLIYAQKNIVSVNPLTGTASVVIPISSISSGAINVPVNLVYTASGVKVKDVESIAGMGWQLSATGQISRQVRGLPDDCKKDNAGNTMLGWLYNTNSVKVNNFAIANVNNNCTDEATDVSYINTNFADHSDTEPDVYYVGAPGLSFQFTFDGSHNIQPLSHEDVKIAYTTDTLGLINGFTIINDKGIKYNFAQFDKFTRTVSQPNLNYLKTDYYQYFNGITYHSQWYLTSIIDPNFNTITFNYGDDVAGSSATPIYLYVSDPGGSAPAEQFLYDISEDGQPKQLLNITNSRDTISFKYQQNLYTSQSFITSISGLGKTFNLNYNSIKYIDNNYIRFFLTKIANSDGCNEPVSYKFNYIGEQLLADNNYFGYGTPLPDSTSHQVDYWGYYNDQKGNTSLLPSILVNPSNASYQRYLVGTDSYSRADYTISLPGNNRAANPDVVATGTLNQITYNDGASTTLLYESNDYYDPSAGAVIKGGGIRTRQIIDYDGIDINKNIVRNYAYVNPGTAVSSGKPISLPVYAFTRPYSGSGTTTDLWNYSTIRCNLDLSNEDHSILYSYVKESQAGAGSTLYEYYTPATNWDLSASPDWAPTLNYSGRAGCVTVGFLKNNTYSFPFTPNPNYDFERGLLKKVTNYNDNGNEVSEKSYTYIRSNTSPTVITALRTDDNSFAKGYAKYSIFANTSELISVQDEKIFDSQAQNHSQETITNYAYASLYHKLLTSQVITNSNGVTQTVNYKYVKDYGISSTVDPNVNALYQLQQQNINIPIETYVQVGNKYTSGQILKLSSFSFTMPDASTRTLYLPSQKLQFLDPNGAATFTPSSISSNLFAYDSKYFVAENDLVYDNAGYLQTKNDNNKHVSTVLTDPIVQLPIASITNAAVNEIGFDNFSNTGSITAFAPTDGIYTYNTTSRNGGRSFDMAVGKVLTKTVTRTVDAKSYVFSIWIKSGSSSGSLSLTLGTSSPVNLAFTSIGTNWQYFEYKLPVTAMASTFSVSFQSSVAIVIDDICFYPENAEVNSTEYDYIFHHKFFDTNTNGVSTYYKYDMLGRPTLTYDQDFNMIQRKSYVMKSMPVSSLSVPVFFINPLRNLGTFNPVTFTALNFYNPCWYTGLTYTWDFGDGTTGSGLTVTHNFPSAGTYNVKFTVAATNQAPVSVSQMVKVQLPPVYVTNDSEANPGTGDFRYIKFYKGGVLKYTFSSEAGGDNIPFNSASSYVDRDVYDIVASIDGIQYDSGSGNGYTKLVMHTDTTDDCRPYTHSGQFTFTGVDLTVPTSELSFHVGITPCP